MGKRGARCQVCQHDERWRIEYLRAGGASLDSLAEKFGTSRDAIHRHWTKHVSDEAKTNHLIGPAKLADLAQTAAEEGASVLDHFRVIRTMLMAHLGATSQAGDARGSAIVAAQLVNVLEKIGRITGEVAALAGNTINVTNQIAFLNSPYMARLQAATLNALAPYAEARAAVVAAYRLLDAEAAQPVPVAAPKLIETMPVTILTPPPPIEDVPCPA